MKQIEIIDKQYDDGIKNLSGFVEIPNLSLGFDKEYFTNGLNQKAMKHIIDYAVSLQIKGLTHEIQEEEGKSPVLLFEVAADESKKESKAIMLQGHVDKQPHLTGWHEWTGPCTPVIRDGWLQGRGSADDGQSQLAVLLAIKSNQEAGNPLPRVVFFMETEEESGSPSLGYWLTRLKERIGDIVLMFCLDSMAADQERLWVTKGLKGVVMLTVKVSTHEQGVHSGNYSGRVPDPMFIHRFFMDQLVDTQGDWKFEGIEAAIPESDRTKVDTMRKITQDGHMQLNLLEGVRPLGSDPLDTLVRNVWQPTLTCIGTEGLGDLGAGNVVHPSLTMKQSVRLPPTQNAEEALQKLKAMFTGGNPFNAKVDILHEVSGNGFQMADFESSMEQHFNAVSQEFWGKDVAQCFCGGSIPFLNVIQTSFPSCTVVATGVLGPGSNEHAQNEKLNIEQCRKLIKSLSKLIAMQ